MILPFLLLVVVFFITVLFRPNDIFGCSLKPCFDRGDRVESYCDISEEYSSNNINPLFVKPEKVKTQISYNFGFWNTTKNNETIIQFWIFVNQKNKTKYQIEEMTYLQF